MSLTAQISALAVRVAAEFKARPGQLSGSTAARNAYPWSRLGLQWFDTDEDATYRHDGTAWRLWSMGRRSFTPTLRAGVDLGNGTLTGAWWVSGGVVHARYAFTVGSTTGAPTGAVSFSLPIGRNGDVGNMFHGSSSYVDASNSDRFPGSVALLNDFIAPRVFRAAGSANAREVAIGLVNGTITPTEWGVGDVLSMYVTYPTS